MPSSDATAAFNSGCERPPATTSRFLVLVISPGATPLSRSSSVFFFLRPMPCLLCRCGAGCGLGRTRTCPVLLDPALDIALRCHAQGQGARGYVLAHDSTRSGLGSVSDPNRRDEDVVRAGVH